MSKIKHYTSWGNYPKHPQDGDCFDKNKLADINKLFLPYGRGRSYGDSCLNSSGVLLDSSNFSSMISFDTKNGIFEGGAGMTFNDLLSITIPNSFFVPVSPGTQFATLGGGLANDVHGKNHHFEGSFGNHIISFKLYREGELLECSRTQNVEIFRATIGGLGLTGFILSVKIKLKKIFNSYINVENIKFNSLDEFFVLSEESEKKYEYLVSWIDCTSLEGSLINGIFSRGNHSNDKKLGNTFRHEFNISYPFRQKRSFVNKLTLKPFNFLYYNKQIRKTLKKTQYYRSFFYPLDSILNWNYVYGSQGFLQHQSLIPKEHAVKHLSKMLKIIKNSGQGSFLVVLKVMGNIKSEGLLSFPCEGVTLAIDFAYRGSSTLELFEKLNKIVIEAGGRIYPAKDACMTAKDFKISYSKWQEIENLRDKNIISDFWKRVTDQ